MNARETIPETGQKALDIPCPFVSPSVSRTWGGGLLYCHHSQLQKTSAMKYSSLLQQMAVPHPSAWITAAETKTVNKEATQVRMVWKVLSAVEGLCSRV